MKEKIRRYILGLNPVNFFVITAGLFGLLFILITPPLQGADETVHFLRAYQVATFNAVSDKSGEEVGGVLPESIGETIRTIKPGEVAFQPNVKYLGYRTKAALSINNDNGKEKFYSFSGGASYSPVAYIGAASGIIVSRLLDLPPIVALYAGRLGNLILWILLIAGSVALLPRRKWVLVFVGLLPMALFQAATINGDAVMIGSLAILLSLLLRLRLKKDLIQPTEIVSLALVASVMVLSKQIMVLFLPLILLLKRKSFRSTDNHIIAKIFVIGIPLLICFLWIFVSKGVSNSGPPPNASDAASQFDFILTSPHSFINVMWNTYFYTWGDSITRSFVGTFGWSDTPLSSIIVTSGYVGGALLLLGVDDNKEQNILSKLEKLIILGIALIYTLAVSVSLYLYYSPVGFKIIQGLQGRYYIPLLAMFAPFLATKRVRIQTNFYKVLAVSLPTFLLIASTITLYVRYYINNV
jgi:uncharacterized membrane protein